MSQPVKVCMHCRYAVEIATPEGTLPLLNQAKPRQCVFSPPTPIIVGMTGGGHGIIPVYPTVNADTVSCAQFDNTAVGSLDASTANYVGATINNLRGAK